MSHWNLYHWQTPEPEAPSITAERIDATSLRWKADALDGTSHWFAHWVSPWQYEGRLRYRFAADEATSTASPGQWSIMAGLRPGAEYVLWVAGRLGAYYTRPDFVAVSLAALDTVLAAVKRAFGASAAAQRALPGGLWTNEVPEEAELPYGYVE